MMSIVDEEAVLPLSSSHSSSLSTHVKYSCGSCGFELNLNSCNRNIPAIDAKYEKAMKRGVISFFSIDESRFTTQTRRWFLPAYFMSMRLFRTRTKLLCRNCGNFIGNVSIDDNCSSSPANHHRKSEAWDGISAHTTYEIKIRSLRPLSLDGSYNLDLI